MDDLPFISIIFPTRNNLGDTLATLASLEKLHYRRERVEVLIWDNGSTDDSPASIRRALESMEAQGWAKLRLVEHEMNVGSFPARDRAFRLREERALYILCIDDDVELDPECLREMLAVFKAHSRAGVVGAKVVYFDRPEETQGAAYYFNRLTGRYTMTESEELTSCDFVIGCGALIKVEAFEAAGGFDDAYFMSHGEVDFCLRVKERGYEVFYVPGAVIKHRVLPGGRRNPERLYYLYRNKFHILRRHAQGLGRVFAPLALLLLGFPKAIIDGVRYHGGIWGVEWGILGRAFWDGFKRVTHWRT